MYQNQPVPPPYQPPQQPQMPPPVTPVDYLNQIAPQTTQKRRLGGPMKLIIGLIIAGVIILTFAIIFNVINSGQRSPIEQLSARLVSTEAIAKDAQSRLKTSRLRSANSNLQVYFTNTNRDLAEPLAAVDVDPKKLSESVTKEEAALAAATTNRLEDARLNAVYDRTYAREMAYQLSTLLALMQRVYQSTNSSSLKEYLETSYQNLEPLQKSFADYSEATT